MNAHHADNGEPLPPELLAAYADGELSPDESRRVEAWLAAHPEARADVEAQRRLARLFDEAAAPAPSDERWAEAMAHVHERLALPPAALRRWQRRAALAALLTAAAALVLAALLKYSRAGNVEPDPQPQPAAEEMLAVASPDDVDIISMDDRDRGALVVGSPPVNESLALMTEDEVKLDKLSAGKGRVARVQTAPFVVVSLDEAPPDDDDP